MSGAVSRMNCADTMLKVLLALLLWSGPQAQAAEPLKTLTAEAVTQLRYLGGTQLSADGAWLVYELTPAPGIAGDVEVVTRAMRGDEERRYAAGAIEAQAGGVQLSASGRWMAFRKVTTDGPRIVSVDLRDGSQRMHEGTQFAFGVAGDATWLLVYQADAEGSGTLQVHDLAGQHVQHLSGVSTFQLSPAGTHLALTGPRGLELLALGARDSVHLGGAEAGEYAQLTWSADGQALAAVHGVDTVVTVMAAATAPALTRTVIHSAQPGRVSGPLVWRDAHDGVYLRWQVAPAEAAAAPTVEGLQLWHWADDQLPGERRLTAQRPQLHEGYLDLARAQVVWLSRGELNIVAPQGRGEGVLAYDIAPYGWMNRLTSDARAQQRDYYLISLRDGSRRLLQRGLRVSGETTGVSPRLTPDGAAWLYRDAQGDYTLASLEDGEQRNLTRALPTRFYMPWNNPTTGWFPDETNGQGSPLFQGWSADEAHALISDHHDVWALPLKGGEALNLTQDGKREDRWYQRVDPVTGSHYPDSHYGVALDAPIYFKVRHRQTGNTGLARWDPVTCTLTHLHQTFADLDYRSTPDSSAWVASRATLTEPTDWYSVQADWSPGAPLTDGNAWLKQYRRPGGVRYLRYTTERGDIRHAILQLPVGYEEGRLYPTVVTIYKAVSSRVHVPLLPSFGAPMGDHTKDWLERGYAVLEPDIVINRLDEAGPIALENVMAGLNAAAATGIVDADRLGLYGFSYGAYQALYILSQTAVFKIAEAHAGMTNLWAWWSAARYGDRLPNMSFNESNQPYLSGPWWVRWDAYLSNSPLHHVRGIRTPLLLVHGSMDEAVPISESVAMFNTMRRLGCSPVVLLSYAGEKHMPSEAMRRDQVQRRTELFDHYLKDAPAPPWWAERESPAASATHQTTITNCTKH